jgi:hypothetical protein
MFTNLQTRLKAAGRWLPVALLPLLPLAANAQTLNYPAGSATNVLGTYTDLGTNGTAISTSGNFDDANSAAQSIGFTFSYNGGSFTQFVLNTNGFLKLGATAPSAAALFLPESLTAPQIDPFESTNAADVNILAPFNFDLIAGSAAGGTEYRVATTGTAPNRVCTVQWKNVADKTLVYDRQYGSMDFQVKLYETTNNIEFVYGPSTQGTLPDDYRFGVVGIKGNSTSQSVMATKGGTGSTAWSTATFIQGFYSSDAFNFRGTVRADVGRTFRFVPGIVVGLANDEPAGAITLPLNATCTPTSATNAAATTTTPSGYTNPGCGIAVNPKDVWFKFTTAATGQQGSTAVTITVTGNPAGQVRVFSATSAAGPFTQVGCSAGTTNNTVAAPLDLRGLTPATTYYVFVSGYGSADTQGAFTICATILNIPATDAAVTALYTLGKVSSLYAPNVTVQTIITNAGSTALTALPVTLTVAGATPYTNTQTVASLAPGARTTLTYTYPVTGTTGTNTVTVSVPADGLNTNNSKTYSQLVTAGSLAFIDATQAFNPAAVGVGAAPGTGILAGKYTTSVASTVTSVTPTFIGAGSGATTYQVVLYDATGANGTPGTLLYTSPTLTRPTLAAGATASPVIAVPSIVLPAGGFYVGLKELDNNLGLAYQVEDPLRTNTFYYQVSTAPTTWNPIEATTLKTRLALEVGLSSNCPAVTALTATNISTTGATITFTAAAGAAGYTVTYTPANGTPVTVTPAPSGSPITLSSLTPNTVYTVSVTTNCGAGQSSPAVTTTFTTQAPPPPYATLPVIEGFEGPWVNGLSTRDLPSANWRNTPATGDNSWRREDDGFASAGWQYVTYETASPGSTPPYVTRFSTGAHSARFHTFGSGLGAQGKLDLYVNMSSSTQAKALSFDYINPTGTDKLEVLVSTDGGVTFGTPVLTANTNTTFTNKSVTLTSNSATTVIRFQATADLTSLGDDDIGIDNMRLTLLTGTRAEALAAAVSLYPNPAHQRFTVAVPAGNLHAATATLSNALGQTVLTKQLNLPMAGGTADFDVSRLASGVYSLQLKSGNDVVVKRVVVE